MRLRQRLEEAGFTPPAVRDALATEVATGRDSAELPLYLHLLEDGGEVSTLIKLFLLDLEVSAADAEAALADRPLERLEAMGVLERRGGGAKAADRARAHGGPADRLRRVPEGARPGPTTCSASRRPPACSRG